MILIPLDRERFVVVHSCLTFSDCCQLTTPQCRRPKIAKNGKIWGFSLPEGDRINWWRRNLTCKRRLWVCLAYQIWPSSVKGLGTGAPQMSKFAKIAVFHPWKVTQQMDANEIILIYSFLPNLAHIGHKNGHKSPPKILKVGHNCDIYVFLPHMGDTIHRSRLS